jgi:hypothetical protein
MFGEFRRSDAVPRQGDLRRLVLPIAIFLKSLSAIDWLRPLQMAKWHRADRRSSPADAAGVHNAPRSGGRVTERWRESFGR